MQPRPFLHHALVYAAGNLLLYIASFVLLPLYLQCLTPADFGSLELFNRVGEVLNLCLLVTALRQAVLVFYPQTLTPAARGRFITTLLFSLLVISGLGTIAVVFLAGPIDNFLGISRPCLLRIACLSAMLDGSIYILLGLAQARHEPYFFVILTFSHFVLRVLLSLLFLWLMHWGLVGVLIASACTSCSLFLLLLSRELASCCWPPDWALLRSLLSFTLPLLPTALCLFLLNSGDRFFLIQSSDEVSVGTYALGYKLASAVTTVSVAPLLMVWTSRMYDASRYVNAPTLFAAVFTRILFAQLFLGLGVCIFQDELILFLGGPRYATAGPIIAPVFLAYLFLTASNLMDAGFYICHRTGLKAWITIASTLVVLFFYYLLIPPYGPSGAAWATVVGFGTQMLLTRLVSQRIFRVAYEDHRLLLMLSLAVILWLSSRFLPSHSWFLPLKLVLWFSLPILLWFIRALTLYEKEWLRSHFVFLSTHICVFFRVTLRSSTPSVRP